MGGPVPQVRRKSLPKTERVRLAGPARALEPVAPEGPESSRELTVASFPILRHVEEQSSQRLLEDAHVMAAGVQMAPESAQSDVHGGSDVQVCWRRLRVAEPRDSTMIPL